MIDVLALAEEHLALARESAHGRSAHTYLNEGTLRQAVIALTAGTVLGDHDARRPRACTSCRGGYRSSRRGRASNSARGRPPRSHSDGTL